MREHRVNPVDAIWMNMDRVQNLMVIECVMFLDGPIDRTRFDRVLQRRLIDAYPVFSRRPTVAGGRRARQRWRDVPDFDLTGHVREVRLPPPGDDAALQEYVGRFLATPLPRDRPLWDIHLIDGLSEGSAIYVRLHHALADGIALTQVLLSLTDATAEEAGDRPGDGGVRHHGVGDLIEAARRATPELSRALRPARIRNAVVAAARTGLSGAGVIGKLLLTRNPESALAGAAGTHKRAVWSDPIDLQLIKRIAKDSDATVNDVLVSALAGALERYQLEHGGPTVDIPTMIPVNLRPMHLPLPRELGNRFALVLLLLPSGAGTAAERLAETKRRMDQIKRSPEPVITFASDPGDRPVGQTAEPSPGDLLRGQGQWCHHQRSRPARVPLPGGDPHHQPVGLGARIGGPDARHVHLHLRRDGAGRLQDRHHCHPGPGPHPRRLPRRDRCPGPRLDVTGCC